MEIKPFNNRRNWYWGVSLILLALILGYRFMDHATLPPDASNGSSRHVRLFNLTPKPVIGTMLYVYYIHETEEAPFGRMLEVSRFDLDTQNKIRLGTLDYAFVQEKRAPASVSRYLYDLLHEEGRLAVSPNSFDSIAKWQFHQGILLITALLCLILGFYKIIKGVKNAKLAKMNASFLLSHFPDLQGDLQQLNQQSLYRDAENGIYIYGDYLISHHLLTLVDLRHVSLIKAERLKSKLSFLILSYYYRLYIYGEGQIRVKERLVFHLTDEEGRDSLLKLKAYLLSAYPEMLERDFDKITEE